MNPHYTDPLVTLFLGDSLEVMRELPDESVDSVVTDPPYGLSSVPDITEVLTHWLAGDDYKHRGGGFMGRSWDSFVPGPVYWRECFRVLKPGGHLLCFASTRTADLMGIAVRLAGFEPRDLLMHVFASGFPKSLDVSKALDKVAGAEREVVGLNQHAAKRTGHGKEGVLDSRGPGLGGIESAQITAPATDLARKWEGWGTALKPAHEPIVMARKPLVGTVAANVTRYGTGALNIDGTRIRTEEDTRRPFGTPSDHVGQLKNLPAGELNLGSPLGRWPSNILLSDPELFDEPNPWVVGSGATTTTPGSYDYNTPDTGNPRIYGNGAGIPKQKRREAIGDSGGYSRFFIVPKSDRQERERGLDQLYCNCKTVKPEQWERQDRKQPARTATTSLGKDTSGGTTRADSDSSMTLFGSSTSDPSNQETRSTTSTGTSSTTESRTSSPSIPSPTSDSTPGASSSTASGGSDAPSAPSTDPSTSSGGTSRGKAGRSTADAAPATSSGSSATSNCAECGRVVKPQSGSPMEAGDGVAGARRNSHPT